MAMERGFRTKGKFDTVVYSWALTTTLSELASMAVQFPRVGDTNEVIESLQQYIDRGFRYAHAIHFAVRAANALARDCDIHIHEEGVMRVKGHSMDEIESVVAMVREAVVFDEPMTCHMEKTFRKPVKKTTTMRQHQG